MDWIRKNPHLLTLIVIAVLVLLGSVAAVMEAQGYNEKFAPVQQAPIQASNIPALDLNPVDQTQAELEKPVTWVAPKDPDPKSAGSVYPFVPFLYSIEGDHPVKSGEGFHWKDRLTGQPIPDKWFLDHNLPVTDASVVGQDPDADGFGNDDEWRNKTDPGKKDSHPPYFTKLFLKRMIQVPFRLKFNGYDGDPKKDKVEDINFQINTLDLRTPSFFGKLGETIGSTKFKVESFRYKTQLNTSTQDEEEVSELTVRNTENNEQVVLILNRVVNSPNVFAEFIYLWPKPSLTFTVGKGKTFLLVPEKDPKTQLYTLTDISDQRAVIKTPSGETKEVLPLPAGYQ